MGRNRPLLTASPDDLRRVLRQVAPLGDWEAVLAATRVILLPSTVDAPHLPPWLVPEEEEVEFESILLP